MDQEEIHTKFYGCLRTRKTPLWLFPCDDRARNKGRGPVRARKRVGQASKQQEMTMTWVYDLIPRGRYLLFGETVKPLGGRS